MLEGVLFFHYSITMRREHFIHFHLCSLNATPLKTILPLLERNPRVFLIKEVTQGR